MLSAISPIDGRYKTEVQELASFFSEEALIKYRLKIEIEYLIALIDELRLPHLPTFTEHNQQELRKLYNRITDTQLQQIKSIETLIRHDVKAIEYYIREKLEHTPLSSYIPYIHFGLTSEDVNNLAYALMWQDALGMVYIPSLEKMLEHMCAFAQTHASQPILAMTHGQSASPTTIGKEYAIFAHRIKDQLFELESQPLNGKVNGATGTWATWHIAYPDHDWMLFSQMFTESLGLKAQQYSTQVESRDTLAQSYHTIMRINTILIDLCRDTWFYINRGILCLEKKDAEVGSSTMPHKINPIHFENAEGNLGLGNALLHHLAEKLPVSRMQRDLSDSTVLRNQGVALAHSLLAVISINKGMERISVDAKKCNEELENHYEVLTEAIQTILRKYGHQNAYELIKEKARGAQMNKATYLDIIDSLQLPQNEKDMLSMLTPHTYTGLAQSLAESITL